MPIFDVEKKLYRMQEQWGWGRPNNLTRLSVHKGQLRHFLLMYDENEINLTNSDNKINHKIVKFCNDCKF